MAETKTSPMPESFLKRSPLCRALGDRGARFTEIDSIVETAWAWMKDHPSGYRS